MMREIEATGRFKRDYKREVKTDPALREKLQPVIDLLTADADLPERLADHPLGGEWRGWRDCHVKPDLILIYQKVDDDVLRLGRLGSHSEIFG